MRSGIWGELLSTAARNSGCVGVFRMEGRGVQLFEAVDGSHFTILGMPLLPLLAALRERGVVAS